ncbi:hypothetical protein DMC25_02225, partial [Caulobacter sp. D4A]
IGTVGALGTSGLLAPALLLLLLAATALVAAARTALRTRGTIVAIASFLLLGGYGRDTGLRRRAARQRQDHGGGDQTFHF